MLAFVALQQASNETRSEVEMRVELNAPESVREPRMWVKHQVALAMALRPGSFELGLRRSEMIRLTYDAGEMSLVPRYFEKWFRTDDLHYLSVGISDAALTAAADGTSGEVELRRADNLSDHRLMIVQTKQAFGASWICARTLLPAGFPFRPTRTLTQPELAVPNTRF
jgi:hypothetical protein